VDVAEAVKWLERAAAQGHPKAADKLKKLIGRSKISSSRGEA
jgi:TPR repeat protein